MRLAINYLKKIAHLQIIYNSVQPTWREYILKKIDYGSDLFVCFLF